MGEAAKYRWLRDGGFFVIAGKVGASGACGDEFDAIVEAAMQGEDVLYQLGARCSEVEWAALRAVMDDARRYRRVRNSEDVDGPRIVYWDLALGEVVYTSPNLSDEMIDQMPEPTK